MKSGRRLLPLLGLLPVVTLAADPPMSQRLELLERRVNRITDLTLQLDQVRRENQQLRGEIENLGYEIERLKRKQRDIYLDIDQRLGSVSGGGAPAPVKPPTAASGGAPAEQAAPVTTREPAPVAGRDRARVCINAPIAGANWRMAKVRGSTLGSLHGR